MNNAYYAIKRTFLHIHCCHKKQPVSYMSVTLLISIDFNEVFNVRFRNELHKCYLLSAISMIRLQNLAVKTTLKSVRFDKVTDKKS